MDLNVLSNPELAKTNEDVAKYYSILSVQRRMRLLITN